ncbi:YNL284C-B-like protein [Saccharomyces cerevisiae Lalvin QA23]|nr:YNL284C-B-like protein [Saccharomyces cerevisiae Lalvin QA23]
MESQQLSQHSPISHGSACASVTSKEVHTNQDPLDVSASKIQEYDKASTKANSQQTTTPASSAVPENPHHASPQTASVTFTTEWAVPTAVHDDPKPSQSIWLVILRTPIYDSVYTLSNVAYVLSTWATFTVSAVSIISWNASEHSIT